MRVAARAVVLAVAGALLCTIGNTAALSNENCRRLEDLARQYAGVQLTSEQKQLKRKLVAWYNENCKATRSARR